MGAFLEVKNLKKYFRTPHGMLHAVDGLSFSINQGKTLGVVGESGCGKSTLGRLVIRLLDATEGSIFFEGEEITNKKHSNDLKRRMQIIFQDPYSSLNPRMTVKETIIEPMIIHNMYRSGKEVLNKLSEIMDTVGLAQRFENSYPHELDGGRRQRIGIARALVLQPKFIVCDEPVSALDVSIQAQILNLMQDLQDAKGLTYMFITHNLSVVKHISDDIMVMYLGMTAEISGSDELFEKTLHPYSKALLAAIPEPVVHSGRRRILLKGELTSPIEPKPGCRFAARCDYATDKCFAEYPVLEEIFPAHFAACHYVREINGLA
ncbi:MAG: ATP-binding cassette domain-containing protein [Spirochaetaceae bacterium]|jgi:peptide/nickel transport system ATP-binding protein|nr:ATP-binding cassette domain-containing protein [Spirochaetaceae bacterium]